MHKVYCLETWAMGAVTGSSAPVEHLLEEG